MNFSFMSFCTLLSRKVYCTSGARKPHLADIILKFIKTRLSHTIPAVSEELSNLVCAIVMFYPLSGVTKRAATKLAETPRYFWFPLVVNINHVQLEKNRNFIDKSSLIYKIKWWRCCKMSKYITCSSLFSAK
jgi:hypothetical protein